MLFGEKVKLLRKEKGLTQSELAQAIGVTLRTVQNYETKNLFPKNQDVVSKLCKVFETSSDYLILDNDLCANESHEKDRTRGRHSAESLVSDVTALFAGGELSEADRDMVMQCIQDAYMNAKAKNKK